MLKIGEPPFLECSTRGDRRFSAFCARIKNRKYKSIEEIYQASKIFTDGSTGLTWKEAKGKVPINIEYVANLYSKLWDEYIEENKDLINVLINCSGLSDIFGQVGHQCQVIELWRIRNREINRMASGTSFCFEHNLAFVLYVIKEAHPNSKMTYYRFPKEKAKYSFDPKTEFNVFDNTSRLAQKWGKQKQGVE